jgi:Tfp pilus assembly protein PilF
MIHHRWLPPMLACLALSGCASFKNLTEDIAGAFSSKGERELEFGIKAYEDGEYPYATRLLQASLDEGLRGRSNRARARKFLAFIHCASGRTQQCREEFRKALDIDPSFELREDEVGHPVWGPVFRGVKPRK